MKYLIIFLAFVQYSFAQEYTESRELIRTLLNDDSYGNGELKMVSDLNREWLKRKIASLKRNKTFRNPQFNYEIEITRCERKEIVRALKTPYNLEEFNTYFKEYQLIPFEETFSFLKQRHTPENSNRVMMFSEPVFIRNGEYSIIYFMHLCCGGGGQDSIWFYKKVDGKWVKWIPIYQGSF